MKIDLDLLEKEIGVMKKHQELYKTLKRALLKLGHWRNRPRGDPAKGYKMKGTKGGDR